MRFYAACLASYNNGILHGCWVDASADIEDMKRQINVMLRKSPEPNVQVICPDCEGKYSKVMTCETCKHRGLVSSAEEWAIHDYEDMPSSLGEYPGLKEIADYCEFVEECWGHTSNTDEANELAKAMLENWHEVQNAKSELDKFIGVYPSFREYSDQAAEDMLSSHGIKEDSPAYTYFDWESYARDLKHEYTALDLSSGVAVFSQ